MSDEQDVFNMDEALASAYDAAVGDPETTETVEATETPTQAEQRARDDAGRFARKETTETVETAPVTEQTKAKRPRPAMLPQELPWDDLPETWQEYHERREREFNRGLEKRAYKVKEYEPIEQALEPYRAKLKAVYGSEANALQQLLNLSDFAERDPQGFMQHFAQHRGLAPLQLSERATQQFDPQTAVRQAMQEAEAEKAFQTFAAQRGEDPYFNEQQYSPDGTPVYPFRQLMAGLLSAGVAQDFDQAYQMAQWARPDIREKQIADQLAQARSKWEAETKQRAEEAQRANSANVRSGPSPRLPAKGKTIEDTLASVYDSMRAA